MTTLDDWATTRSDVVERIEQYSAERLAAYREAPRDVLEHANLERAAIEGGYGRRQLFELIQNGADELVGQSGKIQVVLTEAALYCANEGRPLSAAGVGALMASYASPKTGVEIGRFGLGFKSVLAITSRPEIFSRSGSIVFDPDEAAVRIRKIVPDAERVPLLRLAFSTDAAAAAEEDDVLRELMTWATTVVRLERNVGDSSWLATDVEEFPAEFLLFSPHVEELVLEDREQARTRTLTSRHDGDSIVLGADGDETSWRVFSVEHTPTEAARADAGAMAERDRIPLVWAVPARRAGGRRGKFWAFFPTMEETTLAGIVNAPWKLNDARTHLQPSDFNNELLHRVSRIVLDHLDVLSPPDDPGVLLELLTARGREAASPADEKLTEYVNSGARNARSVPNQVGHLEFPSEMNLHPTGIPRQVLQLWSEQPTRPVDWAHPSVETTIRRARIEMYMERDAATLTEWLEALVPDDDPLRGIVSAMTVASALVRFEPTLLREVRSAPIFMDESGARRAAPGLFRRGALAVDVDVTYIHPEIEMRLTKEQLETLEIREVEPERLLEVKLRQLAGTTTPTAEQCDEFWLLVRECGATGAVETIERTVARPLALRARSCAGEYRPLSQLLLPGPIVDERSSADSKCVVDTRFHRDELRVLQHLGVATAPSREGGSRAEPWFIGYRRDATKSYLEKLETSGSKPNAELLDFRPRPFAGPMTPLYLLSGPTTARYTQALLRCADDLEPWTFGHTSATRFKDIEFEHPVLHVIRKRGMFATAHGPLPTDRVVGPSLNRFANVLPVAEGLDPEAASRLGIPDTVDALRPQDWEEGLANALECDDDAAIGLLYAAAALADVSPPESIRCRVGDRHAVLPRTQVAVSNDRDLLGVLDKTNEPYIRVDTAEAAETLIERWGLADASASVGSEIVATPSGDAEAVGDRFPMLRARLDAAKRELLLQPCSSVRIERFTQSGRDGQDQQLVIDGTTIYYLGELENPRLLRLLNEKLGVGLDDRNIEAILRNLDARRVQNLRKEIRDSRDDATRLLRAVGVNNLIAHIPRETLVAVRASEGELDDHAIADLSLTVHGPRALQEHKEVLDERGLEPPVNWAGSRAAVSFVRDLGFGAEYAGFESRKPDKQEEVEGPPLIGDLHDFQEIVVGEMRKLLRGEGGRRGLLSLPTGAGKTRVTIEALIDAIAAGELASPILWIAQTQELCEQAVETWSELWRGKGPRERLTISRLYADYEATETEVGHQVVIATDAKLDANPGVIRKSSYDWLKNASCVVVDEAHTSIGTSYTAILEWQGLGARQRKEDARDIPLIGLTATPFRGTNTAETKRLVARYGGRRLDLAALGSEDAYPELQRIGILSQVDQELLEGSELKLSKREIDDLNRYQRLPETALRTLAADAERNERLLQHIGQLPAEWPALLFAVSVDHAHAMAALLRRSGVNAAAISSDTHKGARRHYIEKFRSGEIRVLTNYNVLAAGFDAPKVRALYIARPTYVPNRYQQMIGRGLRGPRNGGTERCLLVNIADNIERFEGRLAFHDFDYLWDASHETDDDEREEDDGEPS